MKPIAAALHLQISAAMFLGTAKIIAIRRASVRESGGSIEGSPDKNLEPLQH